MLRFLSFSNLWQFSILSAGFTAVCLVFLGISPGPASAAEGLPKTLTLLSGEVPAKVVPQETLSGWFRLDTTVVVDRAQKTEIVDPEYCPSDRVYCRIAFSRSTRQHLTVVLTREIQESPIKEFVHNLAGEINQDPVNARFGVDEEGRVIVKTAEKNGLVLDEAESLAILTRALEADLSENVTVRLPGKLAKAKIAGADKERLGLRELIGEGRTNFRGSPKNRVFNINRSLKQYDGVMIAPGEEFSFVEYLGEVDGEHGYLPELVIRNNKTEPEFGGGICQVSSTMFRAAIYSGLKITERRQHSYPVQYYKPYGMDATIYIPKPDLRFQNNTSGYILIQPVVEGTELIFQFYGTSDGRKISVDGPHILESNPDGSMKTVFTQMVTDKDGESFIKDSFWSNYKSPALFPHPGDEIIREKPKGWSNKQWDEYRRTHGV